MAKTDGITPTAQDTYTTMRGAIHAARVLLELRFADPDDDALRADLEALVHQVHDAQRVWAASMKAGRPA